MKLKKHQKDSKVKKLELYRDKALSILYLRRGLPEDLPKHCLEARSLNGVGIVWNKTKRSTIRR